MDKNIKLFEAMQEDKPVAIYRKTILGKVAVSVINPFSGNPEVILLEGNPKDKENDSCYVKLYSSDHLLFFERMNKRLIQAGYVIRDDSFLDKSEEKQEAKPFEQYTDDEFAELLDKPFPYIAKVISKINNPIVMRRILEVAREVNKSNKIISTLETRLAELETNEVQG